MPELPEVETVRTALELALGGRRLVALEHCVDKLRLPIDIGALARATVGRQVQQVRRRGKFMLVDLGDGDGLLLHLGMTGACRVEPGDGPLRRHDHASWRLDDGRCWRFSDPRRFGTLAPIKLPLDGSDPTALAHLGVEPLTAAFDADYLHAATRGRRQPIKCLLLDQTVVAGIGNIYASEALHAAAIDPRRQAGSLSRPRCRRLVAAVQQILRDAIVCGGTTIRSFQSLDGSEGQFSVCLNVYERQGQDCPRCGPAAAVKRLVQAGRSTYYCRRCQR